MSEVKIDDVIAAFIKIRDAQADMKERHKLELEPLNAKRERLEAFLLQFLNASGGSSFVAKGCGTVFKQDCVTVTARDWPAILDWIKENEAWEFLEKRVSKSVVMEYSEAKGEIPPGLEVTHEIEVRVRRA